MSIEMRNSINKFNNLLNENKLQTESIKDKIIGSLIGLSALVSSCESITPEEKQRLKSEIETLAKQQAHDKKMTNYYDLQVSNKQDKVRDLETEIKYLEEKHKILKKGKKPLYVLTLEFEEHKADPLDLDKIRFEFEIPVDEEYFKSSNIGDELGSGKRFMSLFHGGEIEIKNKEIR